MLRRVALDSRIAAGTSVSLEFIKTRSAASIATSVPAPMAIPESALVKAGASLIPSPTMATFPKVCRDRMAFSLPSGKTPATTSSRPACPAMAAAVFALSPVSMTTRIPIRLSWVIAAGDSSLITSATPIRPRSFPFLANASGVFPMDARASASAEILSLISVWPDI